MCGPLPKTQKKNTSKLIFEAVNKGKKALSVINCYVINRSNDKFLPLLFVRNLATNTVWLNLRENFGDASTVIEQPRKRLVLRAGMNAGKLGGSV